MSVRIQDDTPKAEIVNMLSPEDDKSFLGSLPDTTVDASDFELTAPESDRPINPATGKPRRANYGVKRGPRKPSTSPETDDPQLERAKRKFASMGAGRATKKFFDLIEKPLDADETEDVDDYFYLLSKKANIDPSQSWLMMLVCFVVLVMALASARLSWTDDVKKFFADEKADKSDNHDNNNSVQLSEVQ